MISENTKAQADIDEPALTRRAADKEVISFWKELRDHVVEEEGRSKQLYDRVAKIETDLQPIRKLYYAVVGSGVVAAMLMGTLLYIYHGDRTEMFNQRGDIKELSTVVTKQNLVLERTVIMLQNLEADYRRNQDRR